MVENGGRILRRLCSYPLTDVERLLGQAVEPARNEYGKNNPYYAAYLNDPGGLYRATGEYSKSKERFSEYEWIRNFRKILLGSWLPPD